MNRRKNFVSALAAMMFGGTHVNVMNMTSGYDPIEQRPLKFEPKPETQPKPGQQVFNIDGKRIVALNYRNALRKAGKL